MRIWTAITSCRPLQAIPMKHGLIIACIGALIVSLAGCAETKPPAIEAPNTNEINVAAERTAAPTRTPLPPNVRKDSGGNLIKPDGWPIQEIIPADTWTRKMTGKTKKGRTVTYNASSITPQGRPVAEAATPYSQNGAFEDVYEWRISYVRKLSGRDGKIFCYEYAASLFSRNPNDNFGMTTATFYRLCDYDGDGKYEFNGQKAIFDVPDWVETLPGDPSYVNNNANRSPD
jgi:hypothetical protein